MNFYLTVGLTENLIFLLDGRWWCWRRKREIAYRRRLKLKKGDFTDEANETTESNIEETLKRLLHQLNKSPKEVFDALKNQTVDFVFTAHPNQSVRMLLNCGRFKMLSTQTIDEIIRPLPTPQIENRTGISYLHETIWKGVPKFLRRVDTAFENVEINELVPYNAPLIQFSSWMGGDRDGNPRVTPLQE